MKVRITPRIESFMTGTSVWQEPFEKHGYEYGDSLVEKMRHAPSRKDGSFTVDLTGGEAEVLLDYADAMYAGGRDNAWDPDGLADMNAAAALIRRLHKAGVR